jgi:hypothetical protein
VYLLNHARYEDRCRERADEQAVRAARAERHRRAADLLDEES